MQIAIHFNNSGIMKFHWCIGQLPHGKHGKQQ